MIAIRNYSDTIKELSIAQKRLNILINKKEELYNKYFPITSKIKEVNIPGSIKKDQMPDYLHELYKINEDTGLSLEEEIKIQQEAVTNLSETIAQMEYSLKNITALEYQLFYAIVVEGRSITSAVDHISFTSGKDISTIWKYYYPKIKEDVKIFKKTS